MPKVESLAPFIEARSAPVADVCRRDGCVESVVKGSRFCKKHLEESFQGRKLACKEQSDKTYIYAIGTPEGEYVKIGRAKDVNRRVAQLQSSNPDELMVLGAFIGRDYIETILHIAFEDYRHRGEWFRRAAPVEGLIDYMKRGATSKIWDMVRVRCEVKPFKRHMITPENAHRYVKRDYDAVG